MKNSRDGKSYSTNLAYTPPEYLKNGDLPKLTYLFCVDKEILCFACLHLYLDLNLFSFIICYLHGPYALFSVLNKLVPLAC